MSYHCEVLKEGMHYAIILNDEQAQILFALLGKQTGAGTHRVLPGVYAALEKMGFIPDTEARWRICGFPSGRGSSAVTCGSWWLQDGGSP